MKIQQQEVLKSAPQQNLHPLANYHFSSDELRVLKECDVESFFQRSLPFATGFGIASYFCVKHGYMKPSVKYGALPKIAVGVVIGYFLGKFSYQQKCAEKIMTLPGSKLGEVLSQKKNKTTYNVISDQNLGLVTKHSLDTLNAADNMKSDEITKYGKSSLLELDSDSRPSFSGLDDIYRPSLDGPSLHSESELTLTSPKQEMTYEELRSKNRKEYLKKAQGLYSRPLPAEAPVVQRSSETVNSTEFQWSEGKRNQYGDTWAN